MTPVAALRPSADETAPVRVLIVDARAYAEAISLLLRQQDGLAVVGIASDGAEAVEQALALRPDVVLIDVRMPGLDGIAATHRIRRRLPATKVLVMTEHVEAACGAGADACIEKFGGAGELLTAIEQLV